MEVGQGNRPIHLTIKALGFSRREVPLLDVQSGFTSVGQTEAMAIWARRTTDHSGIASRLAARRDGDDPVRSIARAVKRPCWHRRYRVAGVPRISQSPVAAATITSI